MTGMYRQEAAAVGFVQAEALEVLAVKGLFVDVKLISGSAARIAVKSLGTHPH